MLIRYYKIFKALNPKISIGAIFTYSSNPNEDDELTGMNSGFVSESVPEADDMQEIINDYNQMFGTNFSIENFRAYYDDVNLRLKKKKTDMKPLDLCLVVGMFLTGFDSKKLNTLYVDKNLEYHGLLQAFSRTNRVFNERKRFGKIVCFRDLKSNVDESIKLFSNGGTGTIIREAFEVVKKEYADIAKDFLAKYPDTAAVDALKTEPEKRDFILAFRELIKKHAEIQIYEDYSEDDPELGISEQQYNDFRSKYLDIHDTFLDSTTVTVGGTSTEDNSTEDEIGLEDIDFCLELLHSDIINVAYILELIAELNPFSENYEEQRRHIIDTMIKDAELRSKSQLIDGFIRQNVDEDKEGFVERKKKADGSVDLEERLNQYIRQEKGKAIDRLAEDEQLPTELLNRFLSEYDFSQKVQPEIIQTAVKEKHLGLLKTRRTVNRILDRLRNIIRTFSWD